MSTRTFFLEPMDAWFFRDGRPYNRNEASQTAVKSLFPPHPPTVLGALRAALARTQGWRDGVDWPETLHPVLGNGPHDVGWLRMRGPYPASRPDTSEGGAGSSEAEVLWPVPAHVLGAGVGTGWTPRSLLAPAGEPVPCDLGDVRLLAPTNPAKGVRLRGPTQQRVNAAGLDEILAGQIPATEHVVPAPWQHEMRVGIKRNDEARTTSKEDHALYSPIMVRMEPGAGLLVELAGVPEHMADPAGVLPLGGESRLAACARHRAWRSPVCPEQRIRDRGCFIVVHLGPARLARLPRAGEVLPGFPGTRVVSACLLPDVPIGGWDGVRGAPLALVPHVAPGSVWFCEITDPDAVDPALAMHDQQIGERPEQGFGHIALGVWPEARRRDT